MLHRIVSIIIIILFAVGVPMAVADSYSIIHDDNGNIIEKANYEYVYDNFNQLIQVLDDEIVLEEYTYDDTGKRVKKVEHLPSGTRTTYYPNKNLVRVVDSTGTHDTYYFYDDLGNLLYRKDPDGSKFYYHPDHLGSTTLITDEDGNVEEETSYLPFGGVFEGGTDRFTFTGQELDATGLMYYGARYYDPLMRQFTQPDTIIQDVYDPQNLNRYSYVRNNPYKYIDPSGHYFETALDIASITWSIADISQNSRNVWNWVALGADVVTTLLPVIAGGGMMVKGAVKGSKAVNKGVDATKVASKSDGIVKGANKGSEATETFKIKDLWYTHKNDDIPDIMKNKGNKPLDTQVEVWGINDKLVVPDGVGRSTRRIGAGYDTVPGDFRYNIPDTSSLPSSEKRIMDNIYNQANVKIDIDDTRKSIEKFKK